MRCGFFEGRARRPHRRGRSSLAITPGRSRRQSSSRPPTSTASSSSMRPDLSHSSRGEMVLPVGRIAPGFLDGSSSALCARIPVLPGETYISGVAVVVGDRGYHSDETLMALAEIGVRSRVSEPERGRRCWKANGKAKAEKKRAAQKALYANRRGIRGELVERPFAHMCETGGCGGRRCAVVRMSASACWSRRPPSTSGCFCAI